MPSQLQSNEDHIKALQKRVYDLEKELAALKPKKKKTVKSGS
jgi:hypothetical protein